MGSKIALTRKIFIRNMMFSLACILFVLVSPAHASDGDYVTVDDNQTRSDYDAEKAVQYYRNVFKHPLDLLTGEDKRVPSQGWAPGYYSSNAEGQYHKAIPEHLNGKKNCPWA